ncbi:MAG: sulfite exporter TauE/SafE family protein [Saprospiraceae bacterium]
MLYLLLFVISLFGGFLSGFLGIGGAVAISPLLLLLPPLFGLGDISMKTIAGLSSMQVFFGSLSGTIIHRKNNFIHHKLFIYLGIPLAISALFGSYISRFLPNVSLLIMLDFFILISFIMMLYMLRIKDHMLEDTDKELNVIYAIIVGITTGFISGIIGAGGGVIMIPLFLSVFKLKVKVAIGTSLAIVFLGSIFGAAGKILSGQVEYLMAVPIVVGSLITAQIGAKVNKITPPQMIKKLLIAVLIFSLLQVSYKILKYMGILP